MRLDLMYIFKYVCYLKCVNVPAAIPKDLDCAAASLRKASVNFVAYSVKSERAAAPDEAIREVQPAAMDACCRS